MTAKIMVLVKFPSPASSSLSNAGPIKMPETSKNIQYQDFLSPVTKLKIKSQILKSTANLRS